MELLKTQVSLTSFLHSEVNKLIQHIIVQDQDVQNNNMKGTIKPYVIFHLEYFIQVHFEI